MANRQTDGKHENAINPWITWYYWILATLFMKETSRSASFLLTDKSLFMNNLISLNIRNHIRERSLQLCIIYGDWYTHEPVMVMTIHPPPAGTGGGDVYRNISVVWC